MSFIPKQDVDVWMKRVLITKNSIRLFRILASKASQICPPGILLSFLPFLSRIYQKRLQVSFQLHLNLQFFFCFTDNLTYCDISAKFGICK